MNKIKHTNLLVDKKKTIVIFMRYLSDFVLIKPVGKLKCPNLYSFRIVFYPFHT